MVTRSSPDGVLCLGASVGVGKINNINQIMFRRESSCQVRQPKKREVLASEYEYVLVPSYLGRLPAIRRLSTAALKRSLEGTSGT